MILIDEFVVLEIIEGEDFVLIVETTYTVITLAF
jgi:hypothetical protein